MKNYSVLLVTFFLFVLNAKSQDVHFGIKGGLNISSLETSRTPDYDSKVGGYLGGLAHIHVTKHFALQPELVYSWQRAHTDYLDQDLKLNYINLPVLAQYMTDNGFRLQTGPQLGFLTLAKTKTANVEVDRKDEFQKVDFAWVFGASYIFSQNFGFDARFNLGLSNIVDNNNDVSAKNRVFQFGVFYQFMNPLHIKKK